MLDEATSVHPNSWWWIKADGCDLVKGLTESVNREWSGDVNLYPEALEKLFTEYKERVKFLDGLELKDRVSSVTVQGDLVTVKEQIINDIKFRSGRYLVKISVRCTCERLKFSPSGCQRRLRKKAGRREEWKGDVWISM